MKKPEKAGSKGAPKDARKQRLARQLRANLQRRKRQARDREDETEAPEADKPGPDSARSGDEGA